ncbi:hypothetical protein [Metakosakonia massiliensis]|uniref:Uncharacterized protein n=1 Tax=Phytobacter massiliensis TaxID=1485952 RepID=A0A6N3H4N4_9ENTR
MKNDINIALLEKFIPDEIKNEIISYEVFFLKYYKRDKEGELRELRIHMENSQETGLIIEGGNNSINVLSSLNDNVINILAGKNKYYFFKLYIDEHENQTVCYIKIRRRARTHEDIVNLARKLGIKGMPYE